MSKMISLKLRNAPPEAVTWDPFFYVDGVPYMAETPISIGGEWVKVLPDGVTNFRCIINFSNGTQQNKDINDNIILKDGEYYALDWATGQLETVSSTNSKKWILLGVAVGIYFLLRVNYVNR